MRRAELLALLLLFVQLRLEVMAHVQLSHVVQCPQVILSRLQLYEVVGLTVDFNGDTLINLLQVARLSVLDVVLVDVFEAVHGDHIGLTEEHLVVVEFLEVEVAGRLTHQRQEALNELTGVFSLAR